MKRSLTADPRLWLSAASLLILACAPAQYFGRQHDDVLFVIASHALASGRYALFTSPGAPPLVHVWPGLPALLLPITWLAGDRALAYQVFSALALAACPWVLWAWLRRRQGDRNALLAALVFAASPLVVSQSGTVMSEAPYLLAATALLAALEAERPRFPRAGWLLMAATQIRSAGLSLLPAVAAAAGRRGRRACLWAFGPAAAALAAWCAWCWAHVGYVQEGREWTESYRGDALARMFRLPVANAKFYAVTFGGTFLPARWAEGSAAMIVGAALLALAAAGLLSGLRRRTSEPAAWALLGAGGMHLFWGWQYERYWVPLLPLVLWAIVSRLGRRAPALLAAMLAAESVFHTQRWLRGSPYAAPELRATYAWLQDHSAPSDVLASAVYARDGYYAARPSLPLATADSAAEMALTLRRARVRYVVWEDVDLGLSLDASAAPRLQLERVREQLQDARLFRKVFSDPGAPAAVYELLRRA